MNFRYLVPLAPAMFRPILMAVADWMDRTDRRLEALEALATKRELH